MKNIFFFSALFSLLCFCSCSDEDLQNGEVITEITEEGLGSEWNNVKIKVPFSILNVEETPFIAALRNRCENWVDISDADVLFVSGKYFVEFKETIIEAYINGKTIAVVHPDLAGIMEWSKAANVPFAANVNADLLIYAFNRNGTFYSMDSLPDGLLDMDYTPQTNSFVRWITYKIAQESRSEANEQIKEIFNSQSITHAFNIGITDGELHHVAASKPDLLSMYSTIDISYNVYPMHAFSTHDSSGDYYIVEGNVTAHNANMYKGKWTNKHGGVHSRLCAYYMSELGITTNMMTVSDGKYEFYKNVSFPAAHSPQPGTTVGETSYTSGFEWGLSGNINGGWQGEGPTLTAEIGATVGWSDSETRSLSDVNIARNTTGNQVDYQFSIQNLPASAGPVIDPVIPEVSKSDFGMYYSWVWYVKDAEDYDDEQYALEITIDPRYKSYQWVSTASDWDDKEWTVIEEDDASVFANLIPPCRIPTGLLTITNTSRTHQYLGDIKIWAKANMNNETPDYTISTTIASSYMTSSTTNTETSIVLPVGEYYMEGVRYNVNSEGEKIETLTVKTTDNIGMTIGERKTLDGGSADFLKK